MITATVALLALVATLVFVAWIGFRARRRGGDVEDYIVARNSQGAIALGLSLLASGMGAWILFAPPEVGAGIGFVGVLGYALGAAAPLVAFALVGERLRRIVPAGHSLTEFVRLRFGRFFHVYVIGITILYMLVFVAAELTAVGAVTSILSGLSSRVVIVAVAIVTVAYTAYGGLRASLRTDRWQAWIVLVLLALAAVALVFALDSPGEALTGSGLFTVERVGIEAAFTLIIAITAANLFHQGYWQRVWAAQDGSALRRGVVLGVVTTIPVILLVGVLGIMAAGAGLDLGTPPAPFFSLLAGLPAWVGVAILVLGIMLVCSTVDSLASGLASLAVVERPSLTLRAAQVVTVLLIVPAVIVAIQGYSVLRLLLIADLFCATAIVPALLSLWRRATPVGALGGAIAGLIGAVLPGLVATGSLIDGIERATFPGAIPTLAPFLGALIASTIVAVVVSLLGRTTADLEEVNRKVVALSGAAPPR